MKLGALCGPWLEVGAAADVAVAGLTADSRQVAPGDLFVALPYLDRPGFKHDGHDYIAAAVAAGAVAVLATDGERARAAAGDRPVIVVEDTRWLLPRLAARLHGDPSRELTLIGITGTNGKTTTCYLLDAIFAAAGLATVLAGTVETRLAGERRPAATTTPDPVSLQRLWRQAVERGVRAGCMEVSSHALDQHRTAATRFAVAVFTNLTQDHLDYHRDLEDYFNAKARLFAADETGWQPRAVVGRDDPWGRRLLAGGLREPLTFGLEPGAEVTAAGVEFDLTGARYRALTPVGQWDQTLRVVGAYNVVNALGATAAALAAGLEPAAIRAGLAAATGAPGRLERVDEGQPFAVLVDYAHTPDALDNALRCVRALTRGRVLCVFGCGGDRDRGKRPRMGAVAAAGSDLTVITSDNPRTEPPGQIIDDILAGIEAGATQLRVEPDRAAAIALALGEARAGDVVLIAGKGHEDYQILGETKIHFDDREQAREWLRRHG